MQAENTVTNIENTEEWSNTQLSQAEQVELKELVDEYQDLFNKGPGRIDKCEHSIDTGSARPIKMRPNRLAPQAEDEINTQLNEMIARNICQPSKSPWASNVILVTKKDGRKRFAIDYRRLNDVTKKDACSIPNVACILDKLHGCRYFSVIDITAAYWCVPVEAEDIEKTAFNTPRGLYEMLVMPFGLVNSQATFQRLMDTTLQGLKQVESYIDDCIVFSKTFSDHLTQLEAVFQRFREAKLKLKLEKCS